MFSSSLNDDDSADLPLPRTVSSTSSSVPAVPADVSAHSDGTPSSLLQEPLHLDCVGEVLSYVEDPTIAFSCLVSSFSLYRFFRESCPRALRHVTFAFHRPFAPTDDDDSPLVFPFVFRLRITTWDFDEDLLSQPPPSRFRLFGSRREPSQTPYLDLLPPPDIFGSAFPSLEYLHIGGNGMPSGCPFSDDHLLALRPNILTTLRIDACPYHFSSGPVSRQAELRRLYIDNAHVGPPGRRFPSHARHHASNSRISSPVLSSLPKLEVLDLCKPSGNWTADSDFLVASLPSLRTLRLSNILFTDNIFHLPSLSETLEVVVLRDCYGMRAAGLGQLKQLKKLFVRQCYDLTPERILDSLDENVRRGIDDGDVEFDVRAALMLEGQIGPIPMPPESFFEE